MRLNKVLQFLIFLFLLIFLINSTYNFVLNKFLIKTEVINEGLLLKGYDTQGYIFGKETLIKADSDGIYTILVSEGQRIGKRHPIISKSGQNVLSPVSGIISFKYDNLEEAGDPFESSTFDFGKVKQSYSENDGSGKTEFNKGEVILKISDNLDKPKLYLELPITNFQEPLQNGDILSLKLTEEEKIVRARIAKLKGLGQNALLVLDFLDMPQKYNRIQDMKIISEEIKTYAIPKKAIINLENKTGIYSVEKGLINFKEINVIGEEDNFLLTDSLKTGTEVVLTPRFASPGRYIR